MKAQSHLAEDVRPKPARRRMKLITFALQFDPEELPRLAAECPHDPREKAAFKAGKEIAAGRPSKAGFLNIFGWKTEWRGKSRPESNTDEDIEEAMRLATMTTNPRAAIAVLTGLNGVAVPVASAIMTCIKPKAFTVIDFRALESLGISREKGPPVNISLYMKYLPFCHQLAAENQMTLRDIDRALWQWSNSRQKN